MELPSKELLTKIYKFEIENIEIDVNDKNTIIINIKNNKPYIVNIYQLLFTIKKWARENQYQLLSGINIEYHNYWRPELEYTCIINLEFIDDIDDDCDCLDVREDKIFLAKTEEEAILLAAEWIKTKI